MSLRCYLRNIGYYRVTKFRFKIIRAERLTYEDVTIPFARGTGGSNLPSSSGRVAGGHAWIADRVLLAHDPRALQQFAIDQLKAFRHGCPHLALHRLIAAGDALCRHAAPRFAGHRRFFRDAEKMDLDQNPRKTTLTLS